MKTNVYFWLFLAWLFVGIFNLASGDISIFDYTVTWLLLMFEYLTKRKVQS